MTAAANLLDFDPTVLVDLVEPVVPDPPIVHLLVLLEVAAAAAVLVLAAVAAADDVAEAAAGVQGMDTQKDKPQAVNVDTQTVDEARKVVDHAGGDHSLRWVDSDR